MQEAHPPSRVAARLAPFGTTIFAEMTRLAARHNAINLSQGFPDFEGPSFIKDAAVKAIREKHNQYARPTGEPELVEALAAWWGQETGRDLDPASEITITTGCTEALAASFLGLIEPGDEVILFEPFYDSYRACCALAGAKPRFVALRPPGPDAGPTAQFRFDEAELRAAFGPRTKAILINTPHNPTGKVFSRKELDLIASLCVEHDAIAITDEVYEHLVFEPDKSHIRIATLPGMAERTVTLSSLGKTFSLTGWKIGWAIAPPHLTAGVRAAHQFLTFAVPTPLQHAAAEAIRNGADSIADLVAQLAGSRAFLADTLRDAGLRVYWPAGGYFIMADHSALGFENDVEFCRHLTEQVKVAAIPPSSFYSRAELGRSLVRFAFCKKLSTLEEAARRLGTLGSTKRAGAAAR